MSQALIFQSLRRRLLANQLRALAGHSSLRFVTMLAVSLLVAGFGFGVSLAGFLFLKHFGLSASGGIVGTVFDLLFLTLTVMLLFSTGLILYSSLFTSAEAAFLLGTPAGADLVFAYKLQGAVGFSSWAFLLLGAPVMLAYGIVWGAPWYFYPLLPLYFIGFILLPGSLGALACLVIVNTVPKRGKQVLALLFVVLVALLGLLAYRVRLVATPETNWTRDQLHRLLSRFRFAQGPLMPNHWMTGGLQAAASGRLADAAYYLGLVWGNGLFVYVLTTWAARRLYRPGYNRVATGGSLRKRYGGAWLDNLLSGSLAFLDPQLRLLIVKDFRTFRRDPAQWAQVLIFSGLLSLYYVNIRRLYPGDVGPTYQSVVSLLNLCATALLLGTYTGRFIYPMISLEGRKFWILGLLPLQRERLLWGKFVFSTAGGLLIAEFLVLLSDLMLEMPPPLIALHILTVAVLAAGLSGLSVGMSACLPNFRETDPSKIAVGFGGTLNLVAGLLFLSLTIGLMASPWHLAILLRQDAPTTETPWWTLLGVVPGLALGAASVLVPLRLGAQALRRMEF